MGLFAVLVATLPAMAQEEFIFVDDYVDAARAQAAGPQLPTLSGAPSNRLATPQGAPVFGRTKIDPRLAPVAYQKPTPGQTSRRAVPQPLKQTEPQPSTIGSRFSRMSWGSWFSRDKEEVAPKKTADAAPPNAAVVAHALYGVPNNQRSNIVQTSAASKRATVALNTRRTTPPQQQPIESAGGGLRSWWGSLTSSDKNNTTSKASQKVVPKTASKRSVASPKAVAKAPVANASTMGQRKTRVASTTRSNSMASPNPLKSRVAPQPKPLPTSIQSFSRVSSGMKLSPAIKSIAKASTKTSPKPVESDGVVFVTDDSPVFVTDRATGRSAKPNNAKAAIAAAMTKATNKVGKPPVKVAKAAPPRVIPKPQSLPAAPTTPKEAMPEVIDPKVAAAKLAAKPLMKAPVPKSSSVITVKPVEPLAKPKRQTVVAAPYHEPINESQLEEPAPVETARRLPAAVANRGSGYASTQRSPSFPPPSDSPVDVKPNNGKPSKRAVEILSQACEDAALAKNEDDFSKVVQRCRHVLAIDQVDVVVDYSQELAAWALNKRGELRADDGEVVDAMTDFNEALRMDDQRWRARHNRGVLHAQAGRYAEAFTDFNDVIQQNPKFAKAYSNRASLYVQAGDFQSAMDDYRRAIAIDPDLAVAHKGRGRVCHMLGSMDEALQHFDAAVLLAPDDAHIASCRADLLVDNARYAQAVAGYRQAIALDSQLATAYRNLAWLEATCPDERFRDGASAVKHASAALKLTGEQDDVSLDTLAAAHAAAGDFQNAVAYIRRAMSAASGMDASAYAQRLRLYESGQLFLSTPVDAVKQAGFQE